MRERPRCEACGEPIDDAVAACRIDDEDLVVFYHVEHEPDDGEG